MIGDVSWQAYKWNKPLAARLMPAQRKSSGDMTAFAAAGIVNTKIQRRAARRLTPVAR